MSLRHLGMAALLATVGLTLATAGLATWRAVRALGEPTPKVDSKVTTPSSPASAPAGLALERELRASSTRSEPSAPQNRAQEQAAILKHAQRLRDVLSSAGSGAPPRQPAPPEQLRSMREALQGAR